MIRALLIWAGLALVLAVVNGQIAAKQGVIEDGRRVLLRLRPVDPRSLMQGDYMVLRYEAGLLPRGPAPDGDGRIVLGLDDRGVATFRRLDDGTPPAADEQKLKFRLRHPAGLSRDTRPAEVLFGAESFFFQEGHREHYAAARYGVLRVASDGSSVLVGLADAEGRTISPRAKAP